MRIFDLVIEYRAKKTIRELEQLMQQLRDAIKEENESQSDENHTTYGNSDPARYHTTA